MEGMDSSSVSASLSMQAETQVSSFTVRFKETGYDEGPFAQQVASRWGLDYHELFVSENDILNYLGEVSFLNDEPLVHGNDLHLWMISKYAKSRVTVLLSGEGADETLGGYVRYQPLKYPLLLKTGRYILPTLNKASLLNGRWRKLGRFLSLDSLDDFVQFNSCDVLPVDLNLLGFLPQANFPYRKQILGIAKMLYPGEPVRQVMYYDQHTFLCSILDRNDRMTMGASIECRVPFLDYRLVEGLAALPSSILLKVVLANGFLRAAVGDRLPETVRKHPKWGFGVPWGKYFRQVPEFQDHIYRMAELEPVRSGPFDHHKVKNTVAAFLNGNDKMEAIVRQLFMVTWWYQAFFNNPSLKLHKPIEAVTVL